MVVLRSREIPLSNPTKPKQNSQSKRPIAEPLTPVQTREPPSNTHHSPPTHSSSTRRRSLRLASTASPPTDDGSLQGLQEGDPVDLETQLVHEGNVIIHTDAESVVFGSNGGNLSGVLSLRSGKRVVKRRIESGDESVSERERENEEKDLSVKNLWQQGVKGKGKSVEQVGFEVSSEEGFVDAVVVEKLEKRTSLNETCSSSQNKSKRKRYSREEKGKEKLVVGDVTLSNNKDTMELELESQIKDLVNDLSKSVADGLQDGKQVKKAITGKTVSRMEQFRDIARKNASRFAHFDAQEQEEERPFSPHESDAEMLDVEQEEEEQKVEDWPGPFSTAMKIIRDRANKLNSQQCASTSEKTKPVPIIWTPKNNQRCNRFKASVPSL